MEFNIEQTTMGNQAILDILDDAPAGGAGAGAKPEDVKVVEKNADGTDKAPDVKPDTTKTQGSPDDLINSLLGDGKSEDTAEDKEKKPDATAQADATKTVDTPFEKLSKDFFELNLFSLEDGETEPEIKTPEEFIARVELEKKKGAISILENYIGRFGEDYQDAFDSIFNKGVDPKVYYSISNKIDDYATVDLTKENNQERIVREGLAEDGYDPEDIDAKIQKLKDYADLEEESKRVQKLLVKKQAQKLEQTTKDSEARVAKEAQDRQQYVNTVKTVLTEKLKAKEFDGIPLNPELAKEVASSLTNENWQLPDGTKLTDFDKEILDLKRPENHALKVKVALLMNILKKDPNLSTIKKAVISKGAKELFANTVGKDDTKDDKKTDTTKKSGTNWF